MTVGFRKLEVVPPRADGSRTADETGAVGWTDEWLPRPFTPGTNERMRRRSGAVTVQRWYRRQVIKYGTFGPMIFTRKDGRIADFGRLSFAHGTRMAHFVRVSDTTSAATLAHFLEKYWRLRRPDVLISVTGSAASLQITSQLQRVFDRGLAAAAAMTNAWIFTGGTDSGVMKLVGDAMHKGGLVDVPLVGIVPFALVHGKSALDGKKGQEVYVAPHKCTPLRRLVALPPRLRSRSQIDGLGCTTCDLAAARWSRDPPVRSTRPPLSSRSGGAPQPVPHTPDPRGHRPGLEQVGLGDRAQIATRAHVRHPKGRACRAARRSGRSVHTGHVSGLRRARMPAAGALGFGRRCELPHALTSFHTLPRASTRVHELPHASTRASSRRPR